MMNLFSCLTGKPKKEQTTLGKSSTDLSRPPVPQR